MLTRKLDGHTSQSLREILSYSFLFLGISASVFGITNLANVPTRLFYDQKTLLIFALYLIPGWAIVRLRDCMVSADYLMMISVPVGIILMCNGLQAVIVTGYGSGSELGSAASLAILPCFYAGVFFITGFLTKKTKQESSHTKANVRDFLLLSLVVFVANTLNVAFTSSTTGIKVGDYNVIFPSLLTFLGCLFANSVVNTKGKGIAPRVADAAICTTAITLVSLLVIWFFSIGEGAGVDTPIAMGNAILLNMSMLYIMALFWSLVTGETKDINYQTKNWHWIELTALWILLVFAPPSIFEIAT